MGIRRMYKFLSEHNCIKEYPNLTKYVNIQRNLKNKKSIVIGIDFLLYAHKFMYSYNNIIIGFWNQIVKLLSHKIIPLYIYDGKPPHEKDSVIQQRQRKRTNLETKLHDLTNDIQDHHVEDNHDLEELEKQKNKIKKSILHIKKSDIDTTKEFFDALHIPYLNAVGEADALCAKLTKEGYIGACLSDDMDMLVLGCNKTIKFQDGKVFEFDLDYILTCLDINYDQFVEMSLLFGCDYIKLPFKLDVNESYNLIKTYGSIENILDYANHENINKNNEKCKCFIDGYLNAKKILITSPFHEGVPNDVFNCTIDKELDPFIVFQYLKTYGDENYVNENMQKILDSIEYVNHLWTHNKTL